MLGLFIGCLGLGFWSLVIFVEISEKLYFAIYVVGLSILAWSQLLLFRGDKLSLTGFTRPDPTYPLPKYKWNTFSVGSFIPFTIGLLLYLST